MGDREAPERCGEILVYRNLGTYAWPGAPKGLPRPVFCGLGNFPGAGDVSDGGERRRILFTGTQSRC